MKAIILSGGKGTRLKPLTDNTPKPMLRIGEVPHLEHIIKLLKSHGITDIIFSTGYLHEQIVNYFGNGDNFGVNIMYREDGEIPLGTAGAIKNCEDFFLKTEDFIVFNGDILTNIDLTNMIIQRALLRKYYTDVITIALARVSDPTQFGLAVYDDSDRILKFIEKPSRETVLEVPPSDRLINAGIYIMNMNALREIKKDTFSMLETDVFPKYASDDNLFMFAEYFYWLDIGTHERYEQAQEDIKKFF